MRGTPRWPLGGCLSSEGRACLCGKPAALSLPWMWASALESRSARHAASLQPAPGLAHPAATRSLHNVLHALPPAAGPTACHLLTLAWGCVVLGPAWLTLHGRKHQEGASLLVAGMC